MKTGTKSALDRDASNEDIEKNPLVIEAVRERVEKLSEVCQIFIDGIIGSVDELPYGLRWLCKQLRDVALVRHPPSSVLLSLFVRGPCICVFCLLQR